MKILILLLFVLVSANVNAFSSSNDFFTVSVMAEDSVVNESDLVFLAVEDIPVFPGGEKALIKYIANNITYPEEALRNKIEGKVYVLFIIEKDGSVSNAKCVKKLGGGCDEEALRVVESLPKFTPGKQNGKVVRVQYNVPVYFSLKNYEKH